jgi:hypothetical protein
VFLVGWDWSASGAVSGGPGGEGVRGEPRGTLAVVGRGAPVVSPALEMSCASGLPAVAQVVARVIGRVRR